jgi:hypothetical protein
MILTPELGRRVFLVEEPGTGYTKGPVIETKILKVTESGGKTMVWLDNGVTLFRSDEETKWYTHDAAMRQFVLLKDKPDLRYLRASHKFDDAHEAAIFFAEAAAIGGGEAPKKLCQLLKKNRVKNFNSLFQLTRIANDELLRLLHRFIHSQNSFAFHHRNWEVTAIVWHCLKPQCHYSAPPTEIRAEEKDGNIVVKISGRPDGVWKRLKHSGRRFTIEELPL